MNRDTKPQTVIPPLVFRATLLARIARTQKEQAR
jgi:hypothetical protein